jgi:hypothetical protein
VQSVLCDALAAPHPPIDAAEVPRWVMAIARNKAADFHRRVWALKAATRAAAFCRMFMKRIWYSIG